jgi:hypothetical protein
MFMERFAALLRSDEASVAAASSAAAAASLLLLVVVGLVVLFNVLPPPRARVGVREDEPPTPFSLPLPPRSLITSFFGEPGIDGSLLRNDEDAEGLFAPEAAVTAASPSGSSSLSNLSRPSRRNDDSFFFFFSLAQLEDCLRLLLSPSRDFGSLSAFSSFSKRVFLGFRSFFFTTTLLSSSSLTLASRSLPSPFDSCSPSSLGRRVGIIIDR